MQPTPAATTTRHSLAEQYEHLATKRTAALRRARESAKLTVPSLQPPEGHGTHSILPQPANSLGAKALHTLAARLVQALLPPGEPIARLWADDAAIQGEDPAKVAQSLAEVERAYTRKIEASNLRSVLHPAFQHLLNDGNVLLLLPTLSKNGRARMVDLSRYVCARDAEGTVIRIIYVESVHPESIEDPQTRASAEAIRRDENEEVKIYSSYQLLGGMYVFHQEFEDGSRIPGSEGSYRPRAMPAVALRLVTIGGEDYGRGLVESYIGDLRSLDGLTRAINKGAAIAAKVLFLVNPNGSTRAKDLVKAESGDVKPGIADDVSVVQAEKYGDFRVVLEQIAQIERRLSSAFLMTDSIRRDAERVTAEEIRVMAAELEANLGGIYSTLSDEFQRPLVWVYLLLLEQEGEYAGLEQLEPLMTSGLDALNRSQQLNRLLTWVSAAQQIFRPETIEARLEVGDTLDVLGAATGFPVQDILKSEEKLAEEAAQLRQQRQEEQRSELMKQAAGQMMKGQPSQ